jgi:hypothetical protein
VALLARDAWMAEEPDEPQGNVLAQLVGDHARFSCRGDTTGLEDQGYVVEHANEACIGTAGVQVAPRQLLHHTPVYWCHITSSHVGLL